MKLHAPKTTYGIELEFGLYSKSNGATARETFERIKQAIVANELSQRWELTTDGSVTGDIGAELRTRGGHLIADLLKDFKRMAVVLAKLTKEGKLKVDMSCGFHIHVGVGAWTVEQLRHFYTCFANSLRQWIRFQPASRRANHYCQQNEHSEVFDQLRSSDRYNMINTCALSKHGTVELRLFAGTVVYFKVMNTLQLVNQYIRGILTDAGKDKVAIAEVIDNKKLLKFVLSRTKKCNKGRDQQTPAVRELVDTVSEKLGLPV